MRQLQPRRYPNAPFCLWDVFDRTLHNRMDGRGQAADAQLARGSGEGSGQGHLVPALERRRNRMQGRLYCLLTNLCTYLNFQRKGAAMALAQWGC